MYRFLYDNMYQIHSSIICCPSQTGETITALKWGAIVHFDWSLQNHFSTSENQVKGYIGEIMKLKEQVGQLEGQTEQKDTNIQTLLADIDMQQDMLTDIKEVGDKDKVNIYTHIGLYYLATHPTSHTPWC